MVQSGNKILFKITLVVAFAFGTLHSQATSLSLDTLAFYHYKALKNANYFNPWFQRDLKIFTNKAKNVNLERLKIVNELVSSLHFVNENKADSALEICYKLLYRKNLNFDDSIMIHQTIGVVSSSKGDITGWKHQYSIATKLIERNFYDRNWLLSDLAQIHMMSGENNSALMNFKKTLDYPSTDFSSAYYNIAFRFIEMNEVDSALKYLNLSESIRDSSIGSYRFSTFGFGELYRVKGDLDSAAYYYKLSIADTSQMENWYPYIKSNVGLFEIFEAQEKYDSCAYYMDRFFLCPCLDFETKAWLFGLKADFFFKIGDNKNYIFNLEQTSISKDSIISQSILDLKELSDINISQNRLVEENLLVKMEKNELIKDRNNSLIVILILLLILFIVGGYVLIQRIRNNKKLFEFEEKILKVEISESKLKEEKLKFEVEAKKNNLSHLASNLTLKKDLFEDQLVELKKLLSLDNEVELKNIISKQITDIENNSFIDTKLESFEGKLEEINSKLFISLKLDFPRLSKNDVQICALHLLGLSTKEIAIVKNVVPKSIQTSRYRIKQKLNLSLEDDFISFLEKYTKNSM